VEEVIAGELPIELAESGATAGEKAAQPKTHSKKPRSRTSANVV
jgi:hypothetical protein